MDFSPPAILPPAASNTLISAATTTATSSVITIGMYQALTLQVTGTNWSGSVVVEGRIGGLDWVQLPLLGPLGLAHQDAAANGIFYVNLAGMTTYRVRVASFSGAGSVTATGVMTMTFAPRVEQRRVNNRVAQKYQVLVPAATTTTVFSGVDVSGYPLIAFAFRGKDSEITNAWQAQLLYIPQFNRDLGGSAANGNSAPATSSVMVDTTAGRGQSDYIFNKGELATVQMKNFDGSVDHLFDVWILGIH